MKGGAPHFVGRKAELDELTRLVDKAAGGRGRLVVISGEAGIGKTLLCQELSARASERGVDVAWSACWEGAGLPPLWPWLQLLDQLRLPMPVSSAGDADPEVARSGLFASVGALLRAVADTQPRLLVMDDAHWADAGTLRLLVYLAPLLRSMRLLLAVTVREGAEAATSFGSTLGRLGHVIPVEPMSVVEVRALVTHVLHGDPGGEVAAALHGATAGNPLFAEELARRLQRDGSLGALVRHERFAVPPTVRAVLDERLAAVSASCRELLEYGAVAGQEFQLAVIADASGRELAEALAAADEATAARIIAASDPHTAAFAHPLLRNVLYDDIGVARRVELHRRVGEAIERRAHGNGQTELAALSHHYLMAAPAGTAAKAARFSRLAARQAMGALAYDEAVQFSDRALAANNLDPAGSDRGTLLVEAAAARAAADDVGGARAFYGCSRDTCKNRPQLTCLPCANPPFASDRWPECLPRSRQQLRFVPIS